MSYVLTSSNDFNNTVAHIVKGLNSAGFSDKDYRIGESAKPQIPEQPAEQITLPDQQGCSKTETPLETAEDDFSGLDGKSIGAELERRREQAQTPEIAPKANTMLDAAAEVEKAYTDAIQQTDNDPMMDNLPWEVRDKVKSFQVNPQFREDIETLQIPQFFLKIEQSLFTDGSFELLDKEMLAEGFTLKGKAYDIDFATADDEIREIDVREQDGGLPKVFKMESAEQRYFKEWFNNLPPESRVRQCKDKVLTADDTISPYLQSAIARNWHSLSDLNEYAELVLSGCFDTVLFKDKLTVTFRVKRKEEINVLDLANFVLCAARLLSDDKPETVQVKTTLHSPGDVILQIWNFAQENAFPLLICYMAIFGGKVGDYEFHSIIGVIKGIINHKYDEDKKKIELRKLSAEADLAEQQALKQKLENIETMRRLQLSSVDAYAEPLATAAKNLAVQPSSATIIDITKILKSQQEEQPPQ